MSSSHTQEDRGSHSGENSEVQSHQEVFHVGSLGTEQQPLDEKTTIFRRRVFDSPEIIEKYKELLQDYSNATIRSKALNHLTTYRILNGFALSSPVLHRILQWAQNSVPRTIKPATKTIDENIHRALTALDEYIPYRFRALPISQLSVEQRRAKAEDATFTRHFTVSLLLLMLLSSASWAPLLSLAPALIRILIPL